jgi:hypothetical protein
MVAKNSAVRTLKKMAHPSSKNTLNLEPKYQQDHVVQELAISDTAPGMALLSKHSLSTASPTHYANFLP